MVVRFANASERERRPDLPLEQIEAGSENLLRAGHHARQFGPELTAEGSASEAVFLQLAARRKSEKTDFLRANQLMKRNFITKSEP